MSTTWINRGHFYVPHVTPVVVDCNFVVDATNGLGITNLKGQGVQNVFMHTNTTPGTGNNGFVNPNPVAGIIVVQLSDNFSKYFGGFHQIHSPVTGSEIAIDASDALLSAGTAYVITTLGTSTAADWVAVGLPAGVTAAVGVSFVAIATGAGTGTGKVKASTNSGIVTIENVGSPNLALSPVPVGGSPHVGGWLTFQCLAASFTGESYTPAGTNSAPALTMNSYTPAGTNNSATPPIFTGTPAVLTGTVAAPTFTGTAHTLAGTMSLVKAAPTAASVIRLAFYMSQSSVFVSGE